MELTIEFQHGPIDAEFTGEDRKEVQENFLQFVEFLGENAQEFDNIEPPESNSEDLKEPGLDSDLWKDNSENQSTNGSSGSENEEEEGHPLASLARKANTSVETLDSIIYVDHDGEEEPQLMIEKAKLGGSKTERQRTAAYMLLRIWDDCYGEERMKTSKLKNILTMSGVSDNDLFNAWNGPGKGNFDSTGKGASATVGLTGPGKRRALKTIQEVVEAQSG